MRARRCTLFMLVLLLTIVANLVAFAFLDSQCFKVVSEKGCSTKKKKQICLSHT